MSINSLSTQEGRFNQPKRNRLGTHSRSFVVEVMDKVTMYEKGSIYDKSGREYRSSSLQSGRKSKKDTKRGKNKLQKMHVTINEIDELEDAMDLLFGEQQQQHNQHDRVKFKA